MDARHSTRLNAQGAANSARLSAQGAEPATITQKTSRHQKREERRHLRLPVCKSKLTRRISLSPKDFSLVFFGLGWAHKVLASVGVPRPKKIFENHFLIEDAPHSAIHCWPHTAPLSRTVCRGTAQGNRLGVALTHSFFSLLWYGSRRVSCRCREFEAASHFHSE